MGKRGKGQKPGNKKSNRRSRDEDVNTEDMDDEIDAFHRQRDVIPLDVNGHAEDSDEDNEYPVLGYENAEDDDDDIDDDALDTGLAKKIKRQQKFMQAQFGGLEDETHDHEEDEKEEKNLWGGIKDRYRGGDNRDYEMQSSDDESPAEEEAEVVRMLKERAENLVMEDFGLPDASDSQSNEDESDEESTLGEILAKGKRTEKPQVRREALDDAGTSYEEVKKDLNALSKEEQMDVVYSSAPELIGLLSELNDALEHLEKKVIPLLTKVKEQKITPEGGTRYLEVKKLLLLSYCQAITFYLLLKSEGEPVRDHPVITRLVEIKGLLDKTKQLDEYLPSELDAILKKDYADETAVKLVRGDAVVEPNSGAEKDHNLSFASADTKQASMASNVNELESEICHDNKGGKRKRQNDQVGLQSIEMLKVRASLEEKLKQKGVFSSIAPRPDKSKKKMKPLNGQLETYDDFDDDDAMDIQNGSLGMSNGDVSSLRSSKISQLVTAQPNKPKVVSGDDDLPKRDDIGERRRKHELRVLAGAGIKSEDDAGIELGASRTAEDDDMEDGDNEDTGESEDEFYKQVKSQRAKRLSSKAEIYTRIPATPSLPETVDGKRHITNQILKNRGLTRTRNKQLKNPRKKYRSKHEKAVVRRKGQVRDMRKPTGPYGGEATGINPGISRSTRFKN